MGFGECGLSLSNRRLKSRDCSARNSVPMCQPYTTAGLNVLVLIPESVVFV